MRISLVFAIAALAWLSQPTSAATTEASGPADSARYTFYRVRENFVRLDVQTGQLSECGWGESGWFCRVVPDERLALEAEIARLYEVNIALKKALLDHGVALPDGITSDAASGVADRARPVAGWTRVTSALGELWKRMVDVMANLQRDMLRKS